MAPANIAYVVLGLLYGEGDFKKSMLYANNCGDDTDCTAATVGSIMGIVYGASNIPGDWKEYIGDNIKSVSINGSYWRRVPLTCTELTDRVIAQIPVVLQAYGVDVLMTDDESSRGDVNADKILEGYAQKVISRSPYSFEVNSVPYIDAVVEFDRAPIVKPGDDITLKVTFRNRRQNPHYMEMDVRLPEGWSADYERQAFLIHDSIKFDGFGKWEMTIHVGENVEAINRIPVIAWCHGNATPVFMPVTILG